jgi:hypothetical protein
MTISKNIIRKIINIIFFIFWTCKGNSERITIIERNAWNAFPIIRQDRLDFCFRNGKPFDGICIHYSGFSSDISPIALQKYHMIHLRCDDIMYHYMIDSRGKIYQGRDTTYFYNMPDDQNSHIHVCCISDMKFSSTRWLTNNQRNSLNKLILQLMNDFNIISKNVYFYDSTGYENLELK